MLLFLLHYSSWFLCSIFHLWGFNNWKSPQWSYYCVCVKQLQSWRFILKCALDAYSSFWSEKRALHVMHTADLDVTEHLLAALCVCAVCDSRALWRWSPKTLQWLKRVCGSRDSDLWVRHRIRFGHFAPRKRLHKLSWADTIISTLICC